LAKQFVLLYTRSLQVKFDADRERMLYEFHHAENTKKPRSVNATYILTGIQKAEDTANAAGTNGTSGDGDEIMPSSPYIPSSMPNQQAATDQIPISSVLLVREEDLEGRFRAEIYM
jgi:DNA polymerase delta subunit 3